MKNIIINSLMNKIKQNNQYDETKLTEIKYGLESIYLTFSKLIIVFIASYILNIFKETIIFILLYNLIRMPSFGLHAKKSWICLVSSLTIFILIPMICKRIYIPIFLKSLTAIIMIGLYYKWSPADTYKRPIINKNRRLVYKTISIMIIFIFSIVSFFIKNHFISNSLIISIIVQVFIISPYTYKLFSLPYDNYKDYL